MLTLGINAAFHDPAACIVADGIVLAAAEEERFTHVKHGKRPVPFSTWELPFHAIDYCLRVAGVTLVDLDHVAYSFDPWLLLGDRRGDATITLPLEPSAHPTPAEWDAAWDPLFLSSIVNAPRHLAGGAPLHLRKRFSGARPDGPYRWHFVEHHAAHAASAFLPSPFSEAAVLTLDGRGERATTTYGHGRGMEIERIGQVNVPHSLGLLYEDLTAYLGFLPSSDEYKVMALASFGRPAYVEQFREILRYEGEGRYRIDAPCLVERFGPARERGGPVDQRHVDIAHSLQVVLEDGVLQYELERVRDVDMALVQVVLEDTVLEICRWLHETTGCDDLCLAGGVALNCVMNARLRDEGPFRNIWIQPASGDDGTALGAALLVDARERGATQRAWVMDNAYLGPCFSDDEIERFIRWAKLPYRRLSNVAEQVADLLVADKVIGWYQGRMEFGPRALGARSILASPIHAEMQARLNEIKDREDFRPVAPVVLEEETSNWFRGASVSPYMLFVYDVVPEKRSEIPAVSHVDGTARIQTINRQQHPLYYDLLRAFQARTGVPVLVNTSFNTRGEPIVCTPRDAIECFWTSPLDALVIGSFLIEKPAAA